MRVVVMTPNYPNSIEVFIEEISFLMVNGQETDSLDKDLKVWFLGPDTVKDLFGHPFEAFILELFSVNIEDIVSLLLPKIFPNFPNPSLG